MKPFKKRKLVPDQVASEGELDDSNDEVDADATPDLFSHRNGVRGRLPQAAKTTSRS